MKKLAVVGSAISGGAAQIIDAVRTKDEYEVVAVFDNDIEAIGHTIFGVPILASSLEVERYWNLTIFDEIIIGIGGDLYERESLFNKYRQLGIPFANLI